MKAPDTDSTRRDRASLTRLAIYALFVPSLVLASSPPGFSDSGQVVTDANTGLQWQKAASTEDLNWDGAVAYCQGLTVDGGGWRLPSMKEIQTIVVESQTNPAVDTNLFPQGAGLRFWTSSQPPNSSERAWLMDSNIGQVYTQETFFEAGIRARCVR